MKNITLLVSNYRKVLIDIYDQHFLNDEEFIFETDKAFSLIDQGLFDSLVVAKSFDCSIGHSKNGYYDEIIVKPKMKTWEAQIAIKQKNIFFWKEVKEITFDEVFKFIDLDDFHMDDGMTCEFVRARLTHSSSMKKYIGYDFLFKFDDVNIFNVS